MTPKERGLNPLGPRYLRVRTPRTSDGKTLVYDPVTRQPLWDESESPLSAQKHLDRINKKLPQMFKMEISEIDETKLPDFEKIVKGIGKKPQTALETIQQQTPALGVTASADEVLMLRAELAQMRKLFADMQKPEPAAVPAAVPAKVPPANTTKAPATKPAAAPIKPAVKPAAKPVIQEGVVEDGLV